MSILNKSPFTSSGPLGFGFQELPGLGFGNIRTADFRDYNNDGIDDRDQGINIPNPNVPLQQPVQQTVVQQMPVANSFLEQLQQSTGLLGQQIRNTQPFATYTPTASDYVMGIPQNRFVGNQFQMPTLGLQPGQGIPVFGGTYTPLPFGSAYDMSQSNYLTPIEQPLPSIISGNGIGGGVGGGDSDRSPVGSNAPGYANVGQLMDDVKSGFGMFSNPSKIPGLLGALISAANEFSLSDLVSNTNNGDGGNKPGPTTTPAQGSTTVTRDGSGPMGSGGGGGNGRGTPGGRAGGTAGGSAGAGGAGGRAKGGRYA